MPYAVRRLYEFEDFRLDPAERLLVCNGEPVPLAPKAFEMLIVLVSQAGRLLTKEELLRAIWPDVVVEENNLDKTISALRKALGERGLERKLIETVRGHGYRFNAPVTEILIRPELGTSSVIARHDPEPKVDSRQPSPAPVEFRDKEFTLQYWLTKRTLVWAIVLLLAVAVTLWGRQWLGKPSAGLPRELKVTRLTNGGYISAAALAPDGNGFAYTEQTETLVRLCWRHVTGGQSVILVADLQATIVGLTFSPDGQAVYFVAIDASNLQGALYRVSVLGGPVTKVLAGIVSPVTFAPDGRRLAFVRVDELGERASLVLADLMGSHERIVLTRGGRERLVSNGPSWSPDGKEIACQLLSGMTATSATLWRVVAVNVENGAQRLLTTQTWDGCGRLVWLRDGSGLVMVGTKQGESSTTTRDAVWFIAQPGGAVRRISTELSRHYFSTASVSDDGQFLLVIPFNRTSQIWTVAARGQGEQTRYAAYSAVQLTTGTSEGRAGIVSLNNGSLVYVARTGEHVDLWRINDARGDAAGVASQPQQLTTAPPFLEEVSAPPDGRFFVFASNRGGYSHLFRVNHDGSNLQQLTSGESHEIDSDCSPDGQWIVYASQASHSNKIAPFKLWKIPAAGGSPVSLGETEAQSPHFSPDGQWLSYIQPESPGRWRAVVLPAAGGTPLKMFKVPNAAESNIGYRWMPNGQGLTYILKGKTCDNLWYQPLDGSAPHALTDFNSGELYNYAFSRDGQHLFLARGHSIRDVLLVRDFRWTTSMAP